MTVLEVERLKLRSHYLYMGIRAMGEVMSKEQLVSSKKDGSLGRPTLKNWTNRGAHAGDREGSIRKVAEEIREVMFQKPEEGRIS